MTARTAYGPSRGVAGERAGAMGTDTSYDVRSDRVFVPPASIPSEPRRLRRNHSTLRHPFDPSAHGPRPPFHARATLTSLPFTSIDSQTLTALNPAHLKVIPASTTRAIVPAERHTARRPRASSPPAPISRPPKNKISPPTAGAHRRPPRPSLPSHPSGAARPGGGRDPRGRVDAHGHRVHRGSRQLLRRAAQGRDTRRQTTGVPWETPPPVRPCVYTETSFTPPFPLVPSRARVPSPSSA